MAGLGYLSCSDKVVEPSEKLGAEFGIKPYTDIAEMVEAERPDIVHLATWPDTRVELMSLVAELGVPLCTVEKPIATGVDDWRQLCELEAKSQTKFAVCHQLRWQQDLVNCCRPAGPRH